MDKKTKQPFAIAMKDGRLCVRGSLRCSIPKMKLRR